MFSQRWLKSVFILVLMLGLLIVAVLSNQKDPAPPSTPSSGLPYGPVPSYPDVTDIAPAAVDLSSPLTLPSLTYGIQTFFWWDSSYRNIGLDHVNMMQFSHVRQDFAWVDIEPKATTKDDPLRYRWHESDAMMADIEAKGVQVLARLSHAPDWAIDTSIAYEDAPFDLERLGEYCGAVASRYKGRIAAYQIWNEPNLEREWAYLPPSPVGYVKLMKACVEAIRIADPAALIISAGLAPTGNRDLTALDDEEFFWKLYEAGFSQYFDVLGVHAPGFKFAPETDPNEIVAEGYYRWQCFRHVEHIRAIMVANGDAHKQMAITEMGWTIDPRPDSIMYWFHVTPEVQADYLARAYQYAAENWRPWMGLMVSLYYPNPAWTQEDEQYWWAIGEVAELPFGMDGRPAWPALVQMAKISSNPAYTHPARDEQLNPIQ